MNNKRKRGRPTEAPLTERVHARVTKAEHARFIALGGSEWLRKQLAAAQDQGEVKSLREKLAETKEQSETRWAGYVRESNRRREIEAVAEKLDRERRALLAERDDLLENGKQAIRWAPSSAHWSNELKRLFGDDARLGIDALESKLRNAQAERDALRADVAEWKRVAAAQAELHVEAEERAERLAEALRHQRWCRTCAEDGWESCEEGRKNDALLRDQEKGHEQ